MTQRKHYSKEFKLEAVRPVHYASGEEMIEIIRAATEMDEEIEQLFIKAVRGEL